MDTKAVCYSCLFVKLYKFGSKMCRKQHKETLNGRLVIYLRFAQQLCVSTEINALLPYWNYIIRQPVNVKSYIAVLKYYEMTFQW